MATPITIPVPETRAFVDLVTTMVILESRYLDNMETLAVVGLTRTKSGSRQLQTRYET
jgi:hypothetical protein